MPIEPFYNTILISLVILEEDFCLGKEVYLTFSPKVNDSITREAIGRFQVNIKNTIKYMDHICCCCSQFVNLL